MRVHGTRPFFVTASPHSTLPDLIRTTVPPCGRRGQLRSELCPRFLPGGGGKTHFMCLQRVHRICSARDKFRLMTIKLLFAFSDKRDHVKSKIFPFYCYLSISDNKKHSTITKTQTVCRENILKQSIHLTSNSNIVTYSNRLCGLWRNLIPTLSLFNTEKTKNTFKILEMKRSWSRKVNVSTLVIGGGGQAWPEDGDSEQLW